ncbi:hypothetical protein A2291_02450 [candidate division WOR-1 bacterium RIFOXYB2_FULL_42_35]|uniref:DUF3084 domain-containing protein n=1 Tax=candidate division WOR-1 bacterium RIFOXYC2_FULL_41_25 TaxID=1802586 RepID=A0A1F4TP50_UNCSA|nr:MAG: hypothetical protein A2247_05355 [candidate division WOR-1 bacterium RIFOXYA2_FULL_41_14]OGC25085.1 MAG: hypothetical protein A2291_02450 [candidate division WOR-1 bacterium RIFOXYB2_FULL_42_35]OGC34485.1 MAG: hypothetical protein A2462_04270 [candidate division WOR-1 bacterium RIFOXYC2_FULL_41_25]OGC43875.1 MAG: hypothetical protein A2548_08100 [candidate division WOR-1 bacterium RIFOXYD2_FULL_41_8]
MISFGLSTILLLLIVAGVIAYVGDNLGRSIGRKRISLFKMRPRHTAIAFTVVTGALIAFLTLTLLLIISTDARTALFGLEKLKTELKQTHLELNQKISEKDQIDLALRKAGLEIRSLEQTKKKLNEQVNIAQHADLLFKAGDTIVTSLINAGPEQAKLELGLKQILSAADAYIRGLGIESSQQLLFISPQNFGLTVKTLQLSQEQQIIKVIANKNTIWGDPVEVYFETLTNKLIYKAKQPVAQIEIKPGLSQPEIEQKIKAFLAHLNNLGKAAGIAPDTKGSVGSISYSNIFSLAEKIAGTKTSVIVQAVAKDNIYTIGPLEIDLKIKP